MYIVTGACDMSPLLTTTHDSLDEACLQMAKLLGYEMQRHAGEAVLAVATALAEAHRHLSEKYSNGDYMHNNYIFGSSDSTVFGHSADLGDNPYCPDWFVTIVRYDAA